MSDEAINFCDKNSHCVNTVGSFKCECDNGYRLDGHREDTTKKINCLDVNECAEKSGNCSYNATCENKNGGYDCVCKVGLTWSYNLQKCIDINECDTQSFYHEACESNSVCENTFASYRCICKHGWKNIDFKSCKGEDIYIHFIFFSSF